LLSNSAAFNRLENIALSLSIRRYLRLLATAYFAVFFVPSALANTNVSVPVLCYHRFGPTVADSMTVTTAVFESHLKYLHDNGYTVIPLQNLVDYELGKAPPPPAKSVVITMDDGHRSVYEQALPLIKQYGIPVTLFIYPSAISNSHAPYAMTWEQLHELVDTGLFTIQSHTYWHPNFKTEKKRLSPTEYDKFVTTQLQKSRAVLAKRFGTNVDVLAWPFGIYDDDLLARAKAAGYVAAFSIDGKSVHEGERLQALPRFLMSNAQQGKIFAQMVAPVHNTTAQR
jgi:peptidoglycan/xylan/chitin deacetylase (PgdA/CDA1 family)